MAFSNTKSSYRCVLLYIYVYIYICTHTRTNTHIYIYVCISTYLCIDINIEKHELCHNKVFDKCPVELQRGHKSVSGSGTFKFWG